MTPLSLAPFGPFTGVIDSGNPALSLAGKCRAMQGFDLVGAGKLVTRSGTQTVLTFKDDAGSPADVTSVCGVWQFKDKAIAVAHSTGQTDAYLYVLKSDLTDWYNTAGTLQGTTSPQPAAVLWTSITTSPDVFVSEGLGELTIAHAQGVDSSALNFATKKWDGAFPVALSTLTADLDASGGAEDLYFNGVISFQNHTFGWGFGSGTTATTGYDPSKLRFSAINFGAFSAADSITIGNRVKSDRERIINAGIAGNALIVQGSYITTRVLGYGRSSWQRQIVSESIGISGPKAGVSHGGSWYFWALGYGPARVSESGPVEPLWDAVKALAASVVNPEKIVAAREPDTDCIVWYVDTGSGIRTRVAYHTPTNIFLAADDDIGVVLKAAGEVAPIVASTAAGVAPPSGPPTSASTTAVGGSVATANWTNGDTSAQTQIELRLQGASTWTVVTTVAAGQSTYTFAGLLNVTAYEWRAAHVRSGQYSTYLGESASTQFTTTDQLQPPTNLDGEQLSITQIRATWTNSGESGVSTEVYMEDPIGSGTYILKTTAGVGSSSAKFAVTHGAGTYLVKIRHTKSGLVPSDYDGPIGVPVS